MKRPIATSELPASAFRLLVVNGIATDELHLCHVSLSAARGSSSPFTRGKRCADRSVLPLCCNPAVVIAVHDRKAHSAREMTGFVSKT
jgi:hypothetical protein